MLQTLREDAGLSKTELARRLGVTPPAITRLEKRPPQASFTTLARYAHACGFHLCLYYK
ncbi:helix-turn-helix domain-containing protein [Serratia plymuthica]|uniref:helix-turn-helix domain-containing protein n=1 Tax=Serratia plymuthica TaxID=82996 RepID=UPI0021B7A8E3|nr:helix-turn-helix transcriptional regulator [Serratia plymuthica]